MKTPIRIVKYASPLVQAAIDALPADMQGRLARMFDFIQANGLEAAPFGWTKHLEDKLWELRLSGRDGIARAIYLTTSGRRLVVLRVFVKKTQKTPPRELAIARERARLIS